MRPVQFGVHMHAPSVEQVNVAEHAPQTPPQPSGPHAFPEHEGMQIVAMHWPEVLQVWFEGQVPHEPPHASLPQARPSHAGVHGCWASSWRYVDSSSCSHVDRGPVGGIVFWTSAALVMASDRRRISVSVSYTAPAGTTPAAALAVV